VEDPEALFQQGFDLGAAFAGDGRGLIIGESVPGGTTTAMAVLRAMRLPDRVSSSSESDLYLLKRAIVDTAIERANLHVHSDALTIVRELGDPMQAFAMGMICAAAPTIPVMLAGGTQMAAVLGLTHRLLQENNRKLPVNHVVLATTPWVARDPHADLAAILEAAGGWPAAIPRLDFSAMHCESLRAYERFLVKEGVGAGGLALAALLSGQATLTELHEEIDAQYQRFVSDPIATDVPFPTCR
jgi:NaMN:DMB phosphoribosyltransferase